MAKPLDIIPASDPVRAMLSYVEVLSGDRAIYITPREKFGEQPKRDLPSEVADSIAAIIESSGTSGTPKKIALSLSALRHAAVAGQSRLGPAGQWLLALPINFIAGQQVLVRSVLSDTQPVILNSAMPFTAEAFARSASLMTSDVKYSSLVPLQLARLVAAAKVDAALLDSLRSFRALLVGGQAVAPELLEQAKELGIKVVVSYGMTETAGGCVYDGIPLDGVRLKIASDGRLLIQGEILAEDLPEWLATNDLAELVDGRLVILGRADRVLISGGLKISLDEVEYLASQITGVEEIAAIALESEGWGQRVGICYQGSPEVADEISTTVSASLGPAAKPLRVIRVDRLPRLATSKTDYLGVVKLFEGER